MKFAPEVRFVVSHSEVINATCTFSGSIGGVQRKGFAKAGD
jgi:hypothetical protein